MIGSRGYVRLFAASVNDELALDARFIDQVDQRIVASQQLGQILGAHFVGERHGRGRERQRENQNQRNEFLHEWVSPFKCCDCIIFFYGTGCQVSPINFRRTICVDSSARGMYTEWETVLSKTPLPA